MMSMHERTRLLLGKEGFEKLSQATVMVVGVGGVGSSAAEALARSNVGRLVLVDNDVIDITNLNRQLQTHQNNIGASKVEEMKKRIESINPDVEVICHHLFYEAGQDKIFEGVDYVIDAIDTISSKMDLIEYCLEHEIPFISSTGMGNRLDPSKLSVMPLDKTSYDPLAKVMRQIARRRRMNMKKIIVVISSEQPIVQKCVIDEQEEVRKRRQPPASMFLVPPAAGLICASQCIKTIML